MNKVQVFLDFESKSFEVGELYKLDRRIVFAYNAEFPTDRFRISPFMLSVDKTVVHEVNPRHSSLFWGLHGVFGDSLPDGWGLLLMKRAIESKGGQFRDLSGLDLLSLVGLNAMGALRYEPVSSGDEKSQSAVDLVLLEAESQKVLEGRATQVLDELLYLGGSPGGARPKVLVDVRFNGEEISIRSGGRASPKDDGYKPWLIKFKGRGDDLNSAIVENLYMKAAERSGIEVPRFHLFEAGGPSYFGVERFDRKDGKKYHLHSLAGMMHADFRQPSFDYRDFLRVVDRLTKNENEVIRGFRLAVFNAVFQNQDDHAKNFSFLMDDNGVWRLAPAYDLSFAPGPGGEHATSYNGAGRDISVEILKKLGSEAKIKKAVVESVLDSVRDSFQETLKELRGLGLTQHPLLSSQAPLSRRN